MLVERGDAERVFESLDVAVSALPKGVQRRFAEDAEIIGGVRKDAEYENHLSLFDLLRSISRHFNAFAPAGVVRGPLGRPLPHPGAKFRILGFTDCVGDTDPETATRIALQEGDSFERLVAPGGSLRWEPIEPLSPAHVRGTVTSTYFAHCHKQLSDPSYTDQLVILANAAPREPNNPDARGCPFVVALLEGDVFYVGTLNRGGTELQELKPYIKEMWHTILGVEETGTEGGKRPVSVFRSQFLLPLFEQLVLGNEAVLDRELCIGTEIKEITGIETDGIDTFGNFKTTARFDDILKNGGLALDDPILISIGGIEHPARVARSHGDGEPGEILLVRGSSPADPFDPDVTRADIVVNGGSAAERFRTIESVVTQPWAGRGVSIAHR